jgi:hypothetical protein
MVDRQLRTPGLAWYPDSGVTRPVPPIDSDFQLDRVVLRTGTVPPEIQITFRWAGEQTLFGVREPVVLDDEDEADLVVGSTPAEELASMITMSLEENLLASGYGIENAIREPLGDVTWLHWTSNDQDTDSPQASGTPGEDGTGLGLAGA